MLRRHSCLFPEESAEIRGIREVEVVGYFLHGLLRILEQRNTFANNGLENQFLHKLLRRTLKQGALFIYHQNGFPINKKPVTIVNKGRRRK